MLDCPGCSAPADTQRCPYCGRNLELLHREELLKASCNLKPLPVFREGMQEDVENLKKLASYVAWTDLEFQNNYILGTFTKVEGHSRVDGFGMRDATGEKIEVASLPWDRIKINQPLNDRSCLIHYITAKLNAYGRIVEGTLLDDGWHGSLAEVIEVANHSIREKAAKLAQHPELASQPLYPKSMWR